MDLPFKGNSGCKVGVVDTMGRICVRKSTDDPAYALRLQKQAEKQKRVCAENKLGFIRIPLVISDSMTAGSYAFDMEHFRCDDAIHFFEQATQGDINLVVDRLLQFIDYNVVVSPDTVVGRSALIEKYEEVRGRINSNSVLTPFIKEELVSQIGKLMMNLTDELILPIGHCHGDLTLSNVLITKDTKQVVLIDWHDSFLETPLQDIVKLRQDTKYHWSLNLYTRNFDKTKFMIIMEYIDQKIDAHFRQYQFYRRYYDIFQLLNFLRLLPYTKDLATLGYLEHTMGRMINEYI